MIRGSLPRSSGSIPGWASFALCIATNGRYVFFQQWPWPGLKFLGPYLHYISDPVLVTRIKVALFEREGSV